MEPIQILTGLALLGFGRKLFWLFVGAVGFYVSFNLAARYLHNQPAWLLVLIAASIGLAGALLAVWVQTLAVGVAAFLAGGYFLTSLLGDLGIHLGQFAWFPFAAGGVAGGFLAVFLFEWALVLLSSFAGASLIVQSIELTPFLSAVLFFVLFIVGLGWQAGTLRKEEHQTAMNKINNE